MGFPESRRELLEAGVTGQEIRDRIAAQMRIVVAERETFPHEQFGECVRVVFTFEVDETTFDLFFNGPNGVRAAYLTHPEIGQAWNNFLVLQLREALIGKALTSHDTQDIPEPQVRQSLIAASAKVWIDEEHFPFRHPTRDLLIEPWLAEADKGTANARRGLCAPEGTRLQVKGGYVDEFDNEVVPKNKVGRRFEIHDCGYS